VNVFTRRNSGLRYARFVYITACSRWPPASLQGGTPRLREASCQSQQLQRGGSTYLTDGAGGMEF